MKVKLENVWDNTTKSEYVIEVENVKELNSIFNDYYENDIDDYSDEGIDLAIYPSVGALLDYQEKMFDKDLPKITLIEVWRNEGNFGEELDFYDESQDIVETQEIVGNEIVRTYTLDYDEKEISNEQFELINENYDLYSEPKYFEAFVN